MSQTVTPLWTTGGSSGLPDSALTETQRPTSMQSERKAEMIRFLMWFTLLKILQLCYPILYKMSIAE